MRPVTIMAAAALAVAAPSAFAATGVAGDSSIEASERADGRAMSCASLASLVTRLGSVIVSTGTYSYDRVVRDGSFCPVEQVSDPDYVPTADTKQCFAGYRCHDRFNEGVGKD